jgi:GNAT superfamily N-acetyltransferase
MPLLYPLLRQWDAMPIRAARSDDLDRLRDIERAAGQAFRAIGMDAIADDEPMSVAVLDEYRANGRVWVATDDEDAPVAYVVVDVLDGNAHVEQVSVHPDHAGRGLGAQLIDHVAAWAANQRLPAVTLTTFRDVPWNAPYYERCGFVVLDDADIGPELRRRVDEETAHGLDPTIRVCMRRLV